MTEMPVTEEQRGKGNPAFTHPEIPKLRVVPPEGEEDARANAPLLDTEGHEDESEKSGDGLVGKWFKEGQPTTEKIGVMLRDKALIKQEQPPTLAQLTDWWTRTAFDVNPLLAILQRIDGFVIGLPIVLTCRSVEWVAGDRSLRRWIFVALVLFVLASGCS